MINSAYKAAQGIDTYDLLQHIAWTDVVKPQLEDAKNQLTQQLVNATLRPTAPNEQSREMIAGKLFGINFIEDIFEKILREGNAAKDDLARQNLFLQ